MSYLVCTYCGYGKGEIEQCKECTGCICDGCRVWHSEICAEMMVALTGLEEDERKKGVSMKCPTCAMENGEHDRACWAEQVGGLKQAVCDLMTILRKQVRTLHLKDEVGLLKRVDVLLQRAEERSGRADIPGEIRSFVKDAVIFASLAGTPPKEPR